MTNPNVFDNPGNTNDPANQSAIAPNIQIPDPVKDFIGEGKKYATIEEALKSIPHAQKHIEDLKKAAEAAKSEAEKAKAEREAYEAYLREQKEKGDNAPKPAELDPTKVEELVKRTLEQDKKRQESTTNVNKVREELTKRFGDKAKEVFENRSKELGIDINALAATSPIAALELFPKVKDPAPNVSGTINPAALKQLPRAPEHKDIMHGASTEDLVAAWRRAKPSA